MILDVAMIVLLIVLGFGAMLPAYWGWRMIVDYYRRTQITPPIVEPCPKVAVILCLRGADPSLDECLHGLLNQDYPRYQVRIVVDCVADSAWQKVHDLLARGIRTGVEVDVDVLAKPCAKCSLKVCSQLQAVAK